MAANVESVFVISVMMGLGLAIYLALLTPYLTDLHIKTLTLLLASCLLIGGVVISIAYLFHRIAMEKVS